MRKTKLKTLIGMSLTALLVGCTYPSDESLFDPRGFQQGERSAATSGKARAMQPLPTTLESPFLQTAPGEPVRQQPNPTSGPTLESDISVRMPLSEVIQRAVANNLDVKVAGYTPAIDETRVTEAEARFDPTVFANLSYERRDRESGLFSTGNARIITSGAGVRQLLTSGGQAELRYQVGWTEPNGQQTPFGGNQNQFWENELILEVTQPLLRDFGNEINRARIVINRNNQRISLLDFRKQMEDTATEIEKTYWQLKAAVRDVEINERLLAATVETAEILFKRQGQDVTRVQLSQANSEIENRRATLIRAKARVRDLSDTLKRLMNDPDMPVTSGVLLLPQTPPVEEPLRFDLKDQIDTAMENRLELGQQQLRVDSAGTALQVARNNELPQLNLVGSMGIQGLDADLHETINDQLDWVNLNYTIGFQFEIPIGNRAARAITQRALLQRQQAIDQYKGMIDQVALDVKTAVREVNTTWDEMIATRRATYAAADALDAIVLREKAGEALTPTFVQLKLDFQGRLAGAASAAAQAVSNYNIALARLEQSKGTLLRYNNIVMEEENLPIGYKK